MYDRTQNLSQISYNYLKERHAGVYKFYLAFIILLAFKSTISSKPMANISIGFSQFAELSTISENQAIPIQCYSFKTNAISANLLIVLNKMI